RPGPAYLDRAGRPAGRPPRPGPRHRRGDARRGVRHRARPPRRGPRIRMSSATAPLARRNPIAKLGAALLFSLPLIATLDPLTPAIGLAIELAVLPLFGVRYRVLARRASPLALAAGGIFVAMVLFTADRSGELLLALGPFDITTGVLSGAL